MNKLFQMLFLAAFLLIGGYAHAVAIPEAEDPKGGPGLWLLPVYNNSGSTLDVGDVVVWDIGSSTGDDDNYVTTTTTGDTALVAGVVYRNDIAAGDTGTIVIRGATTVDVQGGLNVVGGLACNGTVAGTARSCTGTTSDNAFGVVTAISDGTSATVFVTKIN